MRLVSTILKALPTPSNPALGQALETLRAELKIRDKHRASLKRLARLAPGPELKLNLGCGRHPRPGWLNVDLHRDADLQLDLRSAWPFADGSAAVIYSEHFFEHLEYPDEVVAFLAESRRVLAPGGVFSVGVPDTETLLQAYARRDAAFFQHCHDVGWHPAWCNTPLHSVNYHFRQGREHKWAWDLETLARVLEEAGFVEARERPFDPALDTESRREGTLYVDARKPKGPA